MADLTEFVNAFGVEALNETREVHVGDVQQQLRTIQHRRLSSTPFLKLFTTKLPSTVFGRSTASCRSSVLRRYFHRPGLVSTPHKNPRHDPSISGDPLRETE